MPRRINENTLLTNINAVREKITRYAQGNKNRQIKTKVIQFKVKLKDKEKVN